MKKYGKYEKRPEAAPVKQPKVKNMLLQTYFTSLLCLVLCVTMFMGTSYAWFTSEVNNTGNEIYIGTLDVGLFAGEKDLSKAENKLFDSNIRWEPGYTALETIRVVNEGDLAFKYVLNFTEGSLAAGSTWSIEEVAEYFDVWVYDHHRDNENNAPTPASYADIIAKDSGWENAGSLDELLAGKTVLEGVMVTVRQDDKADDPTTPNQTDDGVATEDTYTIALHMKESATADVMGQKISLNVKLVAYQMASENDGFASDSYDDVVPASNAGELQNALAAQSEVLLISDVAIEDLAERITMTGGTLDGDGNTITYNGGRSGENSVGVVTTSGGTIRNLTIEGNENGRALYVTDLTQDLVVSDCTLNGAYSFNLNSSAETSYSLYFTNTTFKSWTSFANAMECANFTNCTFEGTLRPYGDTILTDCTLSELDLSKMVDGETITLVNCKIGGTLVTDDNLASCVEEDYIDYVSVSNP